MEKTCFGNDDSTASWTRSGGGGQKNLERHPSRVAGCAEGAGWKGSTTVREGGFAVVILLQLR